MRLNRLLLYYNRVNSHSPSYEKTFIMTGVELPPPVADPAERQKNLKQTAEAILAKLDPALSVHKLVYVRVVKSPKPSILEIECESPDR